MNFENKVVVVTGAGSGIGRATALAFAKQGARVAVCDVRKDRLAEIANELGDRLLLAREVDVSSREQMQAFAAAIDPVDIVVNNAGVGMGGEFVDTSLDDWDWLLGINLRGVIHGCHFFVPKMIARGQGGHVINVASIAGIFAPARMSAYSASKFAVRGLSESLREELAPHHIGVTAICPGFIKTNIFEDGRMVGMSRERARSVADKALSHASSPEKVAAAILDAVKTNPAVRTVGNDAHLLAALTRIAPRAVAKIGAAIQRRMSAA